MITAIPMHKNQISNHFTKAECFIFLDEHCTVIAKKDNPALATNCAGKSALRDLLNSQNAQRIIVRNIGERMLGKLLDTNIAIYQVNARNADIKDLLTNSDKLKALTTAEQGQASLNHQAKADNEASCCSHDNKSQQEPKNQGKCCGNKQSCSANGQDDASHTCCGS